LPNTLNFSIEFAFCSSSIQWLGKFRISESNIGSKDFVSEVGEIHFVSKAAYFFFFFSSVGVTWTWLSFEEKGFCAVWVWQRYVLFLKLLPFFFFSSVGVTWIWLSFEEKGILCSIGRGRVFVVVSSGVMMANDEYECFFFFHVLKLLFEGIVIFPFLLRACGFE